jgi:nucleolar protein 56
MAENTSDKTLYTLLESAAGYALFNVVGFDEIAALISSSSSSSSSDAGVNDVQRFGRAVKLHAFQPFSTAAEALDNANAISEHAMTPTLHNFLELNLAATHNNTTSNSSSSSSSKKASKSSKDKDKSPSSFVLGVIDPALATAIAEGMNGTVPCRADDTVREILRGCRLHLDVFVKGLSSSSSSSSSSATTTSTTTARQQQATALVRAQLGLGHAYSRSKVKFNPARSDNMIIQSIALLDQLDKDINTFAMRVREWYSWHFPELKTVVPDNLMFARAAAVIQNKSSLFQKTTTKDHGKAVHDDDDDDDDDEHDQKMAELTNVLGGDTELVERVVATAKTSMGMDCSLVDMANIVNFSTRMVKLAEYRKQLSMYLSDKMAVVAPNLSTLIGDTVAARLISKVRMCFVFVYSCMSLLPLALLLYTMFVTHTFLFMTQFTIQFTHIIRPAL